jgi:putative flippase GtrA
LARLRSPPVLSTLSFVFAGTVGFLVDSLVVQLLAQQLGLQVHIARILSFLAGVTATWLINRTFTFQPDSGRGVLGEWLRYFVSSLFGGAFNYGAFSLALVLSPHVREHLYVGVAIGSLAGMLVNYGLYSRFVFKRPGADQRPQRS